MGGMGPEATLDLYSKIFEAACRRGARRDQDHPEVVISSVPQTPDRTEYIVGRGPSPVSELQRSARRLEQAGADFIVIPCNSAHYFLSEIRSSVGIPVLDIMSLTARHIREKFPEVGNVGVLATDGTIRSRLYHKALEEAGLVPIQPKDEDQRLVMESIYGGEGVKSGRGGATAGRLLERVGKALAAQGAELLIAGCTEIPPALRHASLPVHVIDATMVLAEAAVALSLGEDNVQ
jgi:aspartate racemase